MKERITLSIIIVHYKTRELTLQCLRSIQEFSGNVLYEVILIDNGSQDGIEKVIAEDFPKVRFIQIVRNDGFSRANNLGITTAQGKYILLLNSDTKLTESIFGLLIDHMECKPHIGAIGPRHLWGNGQFQISYGKFPTFFTEILRNAIPHQILAVSEVDWLSGSCLLLRRDALRQTGILDEAFFMYLEDVDICKRIKDKGWGIWFLPTASIVHYHGKSVKENSFICRLEYRRSQIYFTKKYYGRAGETGIRVFLFLKFIIVGCRGILEYVFLQIFIRNTQDARERVHLSGKVIKMLFVARVAQPIEPFLVE